ncbi:Transcriptional adapter 1 [Pseudolycoriella hygida]|uniref:Transcriptional adapter 1 n=1 Tax=Pseudolycoriella hygida TaxID=35572 RepID=A0A9Q0NDD3_9DIPT|nr:Transcriptional adapter 1 [Pseudolycoriella hygida]
MAALVDNAPLYLNNLKMWFKGKYSREEFDIASRKLLGSNQIHLHNQFFLAMLNKVDALNQPQTSSPTNSSHYTSKSGKKRKRNSRLTDQATFEPVEIYDYLPEECSEFVRPPTIPGGSSSSPPPIPPQRFAVQELFLPDSGLIMGRLLVAAWETGGLINADDSCCEMIVLAVQFPQTFNSKWQMRLPTNVV